MVLILFFFFSLFFSLYFSSLPFLSPPFPFLPVSCQALLPRNLSVVVRPAATLTQASASHMRVPKPPPPLSELARRQIRPVRLNLSAMVRYFSLITNQRIVLFSLSFQRSKYGSKQSQVKLFFFKKIPLFSLLSNGKSAASW
jgi:hypothetical protein